MSDSDIIAAEKRPAYGAANPVRRPSIYNNAAPSKLPLRRRAQDAAKALYQATVVELILRRKHIQASADGRHIPLAIEHDKPLIDTRRGHSYISNDVRTSRYTVWDFIPKQLFFQFSRVGNFYFLCVGIPQMVCAFSLYLVGWGRQALTANPRYRDCPRRVPLRQSCRCSSLSC